jgi:hypothetical protein
MSLGAAEPAIDCYRLPVPFLSAARDFRQRHDRLIDKAALTAQLS